MIPQIINAELLKEDIWLVYAIDPNEPRFPVMKIVPVDENPVSCPGGEIWCKQFGCVPGDNVFTRAKPELLLEEGMEVPEDFSWDDVLNAEEEMSLADIFDEDWDVTDCDCAGGGCYNCDPYIEDYE